MQNFKIVKSFFNTYLITIGLTVALVGCAGNAPIEKSMPVTAGQKFPGAYINITSPLADGWRLIQSSVAGMKFANKGSAKNDSFGAQIQMFNLAPTNTPQEFESLIRKASEKDTDLSRFEVKNMSLAYSNERPYPCVRYRSVVEDKSPMGNDGKLLLELSALYCRHPVRQDTGFALIYSYRGEKLLDSLTAEAESFIQSNQVSSK